MCEDLCKEGNAAREAARSPTPPRAALGESAVGSKGG
jgi:hypothetical protein